MILTGPEIRNQIALGKEWHGKERRIELPSPREGNVVFGIDCFKDIIDDKMNYIDIEPYDESLVGPNSIDLRLGDGLLVYRPGLERHQYLGYYHQEYRIWKDDREQAEQRSAFPPASPLINTFYAVDDGLTPCGWPSLDNSIPGDSVLDMKAENETHKLEIPEDGLILWPGILYLARTVETIGSNAFVPIVEGRSSVGRLGIHVHVTAGFCDLGFRGTITLEIHVIHPVRIYPGLPLCQTYFLEPRGEIELYKGRYQNQVEPTASRFSMKVENDNG